MEQKNTTKKATKTEAKSPKVKKILLGDMPDLLALGTDPGKGLLEKSISTKRWNLRTEKEIGEMVGGKKGISVSEYTSLILAHMCTKIGHHKMDDDLKLEARALLIESMHMGDVYTAWTQLRIKALGNILNLDLDCPVCNTNNKVAADLNTIEVRVADKLESLLWDYKLKEPIEIRNKTATGFKFGPPRWGVMARIDSPDNMGEAKGKIIANSIVSIDGIEEEIALADHELDELSKIDLENITARMNEDRLGPDMSIETDCTKCKRKLVQPIDWAYNNFFSTSSP